MSSVLRWLLAVLWLTSLREATADVSPFKDSVQTFLSRHCLDCHSGDESEAELKLDAWESDEAATAARAVWLRVRRALVRQEMPPADRERPSEEEIERVLSWIDGSVLGLDPANPDPGPSLPRRLNRAEYRNSLRDLLGVEAPEVDSFPVDASGHGFDNIGEALSISPALAEKLLAAAEAAAKRAIVAPEDLVPAKRRYALDLLEIGYNARQQGNGWVSLNSVEEDDLAIEIWAPVDGEYILRASAYGQPKAERPMELSFLVGDDAQHTAIVAAGPPQVYERRLKVARGARRIRVAVRRVKDGLPPEKARLWREGPNQNGAVLVEWLDLEGPLAIGGETATSFQKELFAPIDDLDSSDEERAAKALSPFLRRAFRRPVADEEVDRLAEFVATSRESGVSFEAAMRTGLAATLVSPSFLFRIEEAPPSSEQYTRSEPIDEFALAARLSYFLWSSTPDDELLDLAAAGKLRENLAGQTRRLLADEKAEALALNFAGQWLELRNLDLATPDPEMFPDFDAPLKAAMRRETELLFADSLKCDRPVYELLTADFTFVNERLAKHYGLSGVRGEEFVRVELAGAERRGLLGHASILTLTSNPNRTSPVKRGKWVLENLLNSPPPPPPANVPLLDKPGQAAELPLRQRLEAHRANPTCASCHFRMDGLGFALEHYNAVGAWRESDAGAPIDSRGELSQTKRFDGALELATLLGGAERDRFVRCLAEKLLTYALGRGLDYYDESAVENIVRRCRAADYRWSELFLGVVESVPFQRRRAEGE